MGLFGGSGPTSHRLDLTDQANNTGVFFNDVLTGFEAFVPGGGFFAPNDHRFTFVDTAAGHTVVAMGEINTLTMGGGDDTVILRALTTATGYRVAANAGGGADTLEFEIPLFSAPNSILDLANQANNSGLFKNSTYSGFEVFRHVEEDGATSTGRFTFRGSANAETVIGAHGVDDLSGAGGNDTLSGGLHADLFAGGAGRDVFEFDALSDSGVTGSTLDLVSDFAAGGAATFIDRLDFSTIDADQTAAGNQAFAFIGTGAFSSNSPGEVRFEHIGGNTIVSLNTDNDVAAEMRIRLDGLVTLGASDILG